MIKDADEILFGSHSRHAASISKEAVASGLRLPDGTIHSIDCNRLFKQGTTGWRTSDDFISFFSWAVKTQELPQIILKSSPAITMKSKVPRACKEEHQQIKDSWEDADDLEDTALRIDTMGRLRIPVPRSSSYDDWYGNIDQLAFIVQECHVTNCKISLGYDKFFNDYRSGHIVLSDAADQVVGYTYITSSGAELR